MRIQTALTLIVAATIAAACNQDKIARVLPTTPSGVEAGTLSAYIAVSNATPAVGENVTVYVRALRGQSVGAIGSYTLRVAYDPARLRFVEAARSEHGMVMTNGAQAGSLVAAGASSGGFTSDELVAATFTVTGAGAVESLALSVSELNSMGFQDQRSQMRVERSLYRATTPQSGRR